MADGYAVFVFHCISQSSLLVNLIFDTALSIGMHAMLHMHSSGQSAVHFLPEAAQIPLAMHLLGDQPA
jgi:hypothetical protein